MPGMDGHQVCRELQFGYTKDIPVVFLTARTELTHMMEANRSGASAYITKPFKTEHLLRTIADVLRDASVYHDDITGLPDAGQRAGRGAADAVRPRPARRHLRQRRRRPGAGAAAGVRGRRRRLPRRRPGPAAGARRADPRRGLHLHLQPRRRVPRRPLALAAHRVHRRGGPAGRQAAPGEGPARRGSRRELESRLLAKVDLFVGSSRLTQSPKIRFKRALLDAIARATQSIEAERDEIRVPPARGVRDGHGGGAADLRVPADRQPQGLRGDRLRAARRAARERASCTGRTRSSRSRATRAASPSWTASAGARRRAPARSCRRAACASSTPSR